MTGDCVDCGMTILGGALRCPACHAKHAEEVTFYAHPAVDEDAVTARRERHESAIRILLRWFVWVQCAAAIVLTIWIILSRGCK